jgi:hypothetical protein
VARIVRQLQALYALCACRQSLNQLPRFILAAVVHKQDAAGPVNLLLGNERVGERNQARRNGLMTYGLQL